MSNADSEPSGDRIDVVTLDVLPNGPSSDTRPPSQATPIAYALDVDEFRLYELTLTDDAHVLVGNRFTLAPADEQSEAVARSRRIEYGDLSGAAQSELEYAIEDLVETDEARFVDYYNEAQPITIRLHQLNLFPGIGKKLRNDILDERKREPFESFEEVSDRVSGLHDPKQTIVDRIAEEIREDDLKYRIFAAS
ncbi:DUF655 domain-containing protein [Halobacteriales archaeon SW_8_65_20]|nr:MAG: DUF655 domain-containing protein [Halobacteriales archaeon QH_7_65_31]PSQ29953.1 MAG: DUF655 domain-containing protein [Halobacteriales archaeon SW_6_65_46]PSQ53552.1 MAG: DUF655 domain-containing protein [Halobacteriales archaeon SW_8_65_20]